jgi:hypothetical protein
MQRKSFVILSTVIISVVMALCIGVAGAALGDIGADLAIGIPGLQGGHGVPVPASGEIQDNSINADTIVTERGVTYKHNETFWVAPASQIIEEEFASSVSNPYHATGGYFIPILPQKGVWVDTPFVNPISINGIHPKVKYIYFRMYLPKDVNVTGTDLISGGYYKYYAVNWVGKNTVKEVRHNLGSYHDMNRGINSGLYIRNYNATYSKTVVLYGGGVTSEW